MSANYSLSSSLDEVHSLCHNSTTGHLIIRALYAPRLVLLLPISIFVLHLGNQQWRQHRSFKIASHSDIFTYNVVVMELIWSLGAVLYYCEVLSHFLNIMTVIDLLLSIIMYGETGFHALTCVDRYLAVVHPVKYRELRNSRGVTIRNISILCVWLLVFLWPFLSHFYVHTLLTFLFFSLFVIFLVVVCFCSLSVLCALFRPGPGAEGGSRGRIDQSKQRAFFTVMAIMGVLCLIFLGFIVSTGLLVSGVLCESVSFVVHFSLMWLSLPSSLVLPLIYLHKTGNLPCGHKDRR